ncbi:hypothetical protein [Pararhizobium sp. A13]|uniref:hypothetical protein n=1 Tax=Pararhizobium sp. A13 TaxID=3133975 RepID=UPI00311B1C0A
MKAAYRRIVGIGSVAACRIVSGCTAVGDATVAARNTVPISTPNWKAGGASLLDRDARRSAYSAKVSRIEILCDSVRYWIALYKARGGDAPGIKQSQGNQL